MSDIASALTGSIAKDGQTVPTANLPMGNFAHTGVSAATARTQYARAAEVQDGTIVYLTTVAGTNTITASAALGMTAYVAGQTFCFIPANTTTAATTININGIGARNIFINGAAAIGGELRANVPAEIFFDGTQFHIIGGHTHGLVQQVTGVSTTRTDISVVIPVDDTIPQIGEGTEITTATITPRLATNRLLITANFWGTINLAGAATGAVFQDATANALSASAGGGAAGTLVNITIRHEMAAGTTSATTFRLRAGPSAGATNFYINGNAAGRLFGGVSAATLTVQEIAP